jgi:hypothetical protein
LPDEADHQDVPRIVAFGDQTKSPMIGAKSPGLQPPVPVL